MLEDALDVMTGIVGLLPEPDLADPDRKGVKGGGMGEDDSDLAYRAGITLLRKFLEGRWIDLANVDVRRGVLKIPVGRGRVIAGAGGHPERRERVPERYSGTLRVYGLESWGGEGDGAHSQGLEFLALSVDVEALGLRLTLEGPGGSFLRIRVSRLKFALVPGPGERGHRRVVSVRHPMRLGKRTGHLMHSLVRRSGEAAVLTAADGDRRSDVERFYRLDSADGRGAPIIVLVPRKGRRVKLWVAGSELFSPRICALRARDRDGLASLDAIVREVLRGRVVEAVRWRRGREGRRMLIIGDPAAPLVTHRSGGSWIDRLPGREVRRVRTQFAPYAVPAGTGARRPEVS